MIIEAVMFPPEPVVVTICAASATSAAVVDSAATAAGLPASDDSKLESSLPDTASAVLDVAVAEFPIAVAPETTGRLLAPGITVGCVTSPA